MTATLWWLTQNLLAVSVLIPLVCIACRLLQNRPALQHALWLLLLVKLVTPPVVSWPWSPSEIGEVAWQFVAEGGLDVGAAADGMEGVNTDEATVPLPTSPAAGNAAPLAPPSLFGLWLGGCMIALILDVRRIARQRAVVRRGKTAHKLLADVIAGVASDVGVRPVRALVVREIATPFLWCLGRLQLVWPEALAGGDDLDRSRGIIAHELAHVRRRDHWVAWLDVAAGVIWWWNPLFWFVRRRLRESAEMACDAIALSVYDDRREYAELFLELSSSFKTGVPAPVLGVSTGDPSSFERRLSMILSDRVSGRLSVWGLVLIACLAAVTLPSWSVAQVSSVDDRSAEKVNPRNQPASDTAAEKPSGVTKPAPDAEKKPTAAGVVRAVDAGKGTITVTFRKLDEDVDRTFDAGKDTEVVLDGRPGKLGDVKPGSQVKLRLSGDHKAALQVRVEGPVVRGEVKALEAAKGTLVLGVATSAGREEKTFELAKDVKVSVDGHKNATLADVKAGAGASLTLSADKANVVAVHVGREKKVGDGTKGDQAPVKKKKGDG